MNVTQHAHRGHLRAKMLAGTLGAGVLLTMGALTVALGDDQAQATPATIGSASVTTVKSTPPTAPATPIAVPSVIAKKFIGKDWDG
ncbi:MAG TPA: hypothetical protein VMU34_03415 [Mycobacterium sp.]|nr:hypothetical protein [Mycobacterium sp.]